MGGNGSSSCSLAGAFFPPPYIGQSVIHLRFICQVSGGCGVLWFPNGELVGDCSGGSAEMILLLVQRNQILLARTYFLCEDGH